MCNFKLIIYKSTFFLYCNNIIISYSFICKKRCYWIPSGDFATFCFLAVFVRFVHFFFVCLRAKRFSLDDHLLYLFLIVDFVIIALLSSFVIKGAWFPLTCFCFSGAWLSNVDRKMFVKSSYLTPQLHSLVRNLFYSSYKKSLVSKYLKLL